MVKPGHSCCLYAVSPGLLVYPLGRQDPNLTPWKLGQPQSVRSSLDLPDAPGGRCCGGATAFSRSFRSLFLPGALHTLFTIIGVRRQRGRAKELTADLREAAVETRRGTLCWKLLIVSAHVAELRVHGASEREVETDSKVIRIQQNYPRDGFHGRPLFSEHNSLKALRKKNPQTCKTFHVISEESLKACFQRFRTPSLSHLLRTRSFIHSINIDLRVYMATGYSDAQVNIVPILWGLPVVSEFPEGKQINEQIELQIVQVL